MFNITLHGKIYKVGVQRINPEKFTITIDNSSLEVIVKQENEELLNKNISNNMENTLINDLTINSKSKCNLQVYNVLSPIPGKIVKTLYNEGDYIEKGETLIQLEAMKMINDIISPWSGFIKKIVKMNTQVIYKEILVVIEQLV
jgi:biotin carboxyl carrier protein